MLSSWFLRSFQTCRGISPHYMGTRQGSGFWPAPMAGLILLLQAGLDIQRYLNFEHSQLFLAMPPEAQAGQTHACQRQRCRLRHRRGIDCQLKNILTTNQRPT